MSAIADTCNRIVEWHATRDHPVSQFLQPGATHDELSALATTMGMPLPAELQDFYAWHNGTAESGATLGELAFLPGYYVLSIQEALAQRASYLPLGWPHSWLPVFADGGGDFKALDLSRSKGIAAPVTWYFDAEWCDEYGSLEALLFTVRAACDAGALFFSSDGFEIDSDRYALVARRFNPHIRLWHSSGDDLERCFGPLADYRAGLPPN
jgi:cell wall assembly regulator SMI1